MPQSIIAGMSQTPLPPPLPPPFPQSRQPMPVQSLSTGLPEAAVGKQFPGSAYQSSSYTDWTHVRPRRPGIITTIGIISIVVGSLGIIGGGLSALYGGLFYIMAQTTAAIASLPAPTAVPVSVPDNPILTADEPVVTGERGSDAPKRQIMIDTLATLRPLNDAHRKQLEALFALSGQDIFPDTAKGLTVADVLRDVSDSGQLIATFQPTPAASSAADGSEYFVIATGRIEVADDSAVFEPRDAAQQPVRVARKLQSAVNQTAINVPTTTETFVYHANSTTTAPMPTFFGSGTSGTRGKMSGTTVTLVVGEAVLSTLLSIYLLIIGILVFRQNPLGRKLHLIYAVLKFPLAITCGIGWWWFIREFFAAMSSSPTGNSGMNATRAVIFGVVTGVALLYPIGLLIALNTQAVRKYFAAAPGADGMA